MSLWSVFVDAPNDVAGRQWQPFGAPQASTLSNKLESRRRRSPRAPRRITRQRAIASWVTARITDCISAGGCCQIVNIAFAAALQALSTVAALATRERLLVAVFLCRAVDLKMMSAKLRRSPSRNMVALGRRHRISSAFHKITTS